MKLKILPIICFFFVAYSYGQNSPFITQWNLQRPQLQVKVVGSGHYTAIKTNNPAVHMSGDFNGPFVIPVTSAGLYKVEISNTQDFALDQGGASNLVSVDQWGADTKWNADLSFMFLNSLVEITATDIPNFSNVTNMNGMFGNFTGSEIPNIGAWDTSKVTNMKDLFSGATNFNASALNWDTSSVTDMSGAFYQASNFNGDISGWDTSNVTDFNMMFNEATAFNQNLNRWNTSTVTDMSSMFNNATAFAGNISDWDTSSVTDMSNMFANDLLFNSDLSRWNTSSVTNMGGMFFGATSFNQNLSNWKTSKVTNMGSMFSNAIAFNQDLNGWDTSSVTNMNYMFETATSFNGDVDGWNTSSVTDMVGLFRDARSFNRDVSKWDVSNVEDFSAIFAQASVFNQDLAKWNTSSATVMNSAFFGATTFNQDISEWNVSGVVDFGGMFGEAESFDQNLGNWDISNTTDMSDMLSSSGLSCVNYEATLEGWASQQVQSNVNLGAAGLHYDREAEPYRNILINGHGWHLTGDEFSDTCGDGSMAVKENTKTNALAVVNPFRDKLQIISPDKVLKTEVYDINGRMVLTFTGNETDTTHLPRGFYLLKISTENGTVVKKVVKE